MNATPEALRAALQRAARRARKFGCSVHLTIDAKGIVVGEIIPPRELRAARQREGLPMSGLDFGCENCGWINGHGTGCPRLAPRGSDADDSLRQADLDFLARVRAADLPGLRRMKRLLPEYAPGWKHVTITRALKAAYLAP